MDIRDELTYGIIVEYVTSLDQRRGKVGPAVRKRREVWDWHYEARFNEGDPEDIIGPELVRWHRMAGNRVEYRVGRVGKEKLVRFVEDRALYRIDSSGVPAITCADIDKFYPLA